MGNKIKGLNRDNPDIEKTLKEVEANQEKIFNERRDSAFEEDTGKILAKRPLADLSPQKAEQAGGLHFTVMPSVTINGKELELNIGDKPKEATP